MVGIIDYGMGNLLSVFHAVETVGFDVKICRQPEELNELERLILPGVGAFRDCMKHLKQTGFAAALERAVLQQRKPILGICLGMQAMARRSFEGGEHAGLGWFAADVVRLQPADPSLRVPQVGWNQVQHRQAAPLFSSLPSPPEFYFVHSYFMKCDHEEDVLATCDYGGRVTAAVGRGNIFATQFHPEKSQEHGLRVLQNFLEWRPPSC
jgi:glutamine amidotransferase